MVLDLMGYRIKLAGLLFEGEGQYLFFFKDTTLIMVAEKRSANKRGRLKVESLKL